MRTFAIVALAVLTQGCFSLDPFLYGPERTDHYDFKPEGASADDTVTADRIEPTSIVVSDAVTLGAVYLKAAQQPPRAYVIYFHGKGGTLDTHFGRAKRWSNLGYDVLAFDYRGWGTSTNVTPTEAGILEDTTAVRRWMVDRIGAANESRLVYYGHSFGTATSTQLAEQQPPALLVLESAFASIQDFETDSSGMNFPVDFISNCRWATVDKIRNIHVPVLLAHGKADDFVRPEFSEKIYANANEPKQIHIADGAHHSDIPTVMGGQQYAELMTAFIDANVR